MGQQITYEIGVENIGRRVKVMGRAGYQNGHGGKLTAAQQKNATVLLDHTSTPITVEWSSVRDWTSQNPLPMVMPTTRAAPKPVLKATTTAPSAHPVAAKPAESPFDLYRSLGAELEAATANVSAAEEMVDQALEQYQAAKAEHEQAVEGLRQLRGKAASALAAIDHHLIGTTAAQPAR